MDNGLGLSSEDTFSEAERAFFDTRGEKAEGLFEAPPESAAKVEKAEPEKKEPAKADEPDDSEPGTISIESDGRIRDAKTGKFVPEQAYVRVKNRVKDVEKERDELRQKWADINARFEMTKEIIAKEDEPEAKAKAEEDPEPNPETDIFGHNRWLARQLKKAREAPHEEIAQVRQRVETEAMQRTFDEDIRAFVGKQPAFGAAVDFLQKNRADELRSFGLDDAEIKEKIKGDLRDIAVAAHSRKRGMAETMYNIAMARGFKPQTTDDNKAANGATKTKAPAEEALEQIKKGQETSLSLSSAGGGSAGELTIDRYMAMSENEIIEFGSTPQGKRQLQRLMGGRT